MANYQNQNTLTSRFEGTDVKSVAAAIAAISVTGTGLGLSGPLLSLLMKHDGLSSSIVGANTAVAGLAAIIIVPFVNRIARLLGLVNTLIGCSVICAICLVSMYFTNPVPAWFVLRFLMSICLAMMFVLSEFWINYAASEKARGLILGIYGTVLSVGFATGPAVVSFVGIEGIRPFLIGAVLILAAIFPLIFAKSGQPVMEAGKSKQSIMPYIFMVPLATGAGFTFGAAEQSQLSLLPVHGTLTGMTASEAAFILTVLGIGNIVFQIPLGIWSDRVKDRRTILLVCCLSGVAGALALPMVLGNVWLAYLTVFLWGGAIGGLYTVGLAHLGSRLSGTDLAQANAAFVLCYALGMTIAPQLTGFSMDQLGTNGFPVALGIFFIAYLILILWRKIAPAT